MNEETNYDKEPAFEGGGFGCYFSFNVYEGPKSVNETVDWLKWLDFTSIRYLLGGINDLKVPPR